MKTRLCRVERQAEDALLWRQAAWLAAETGGAAEDFVPELRRLARVITRLRHETGDDVGRLLARLADEEGLPLAELTAACDRLARPAPLGR